MLEALIAFALRAEAEPQRTAIVDAGGRVSYGELLFSVKGMAAWAADLPQIVGILAPKTRQSLVWHLALAWAGRTVVPLPEFFSPSQLAHLIDDAGLSVVVTPAEMVERVLSLGVAAVSPQYATSLLALPVGGARWIIYTSGTSGRPKGVMLGESQMDASIKALAAAVEASPEDRMLSVLPFALLLELVAGMALPLAAGASIALCPDPRRMAEAAETFNATATVLVPEMLAGWVAGLEGQGLSGPSGMRFVAVGGAPVPPRLAERAWALGLPVHEGYGLSECCSVVAVNRPGQRQAGTVGQPLPGVSVTIEDGEIVVGGPTVMAGYLGGAVTGHQCRTGDVGRFDPQGRLIVDGRKDDMIVTAKGRNIHPEWIESMLLADLRIGRCAVLNGGDHPRAVLVPSDPQLQGADDAAIQSLVLDLTAAAPDYARPRRNLVLPDTLLRQHDLITGNGRLRRRAITAYLESLQ